MTGRLPFTYGHSEKCIGSCIQDMLPTLLSGILPAVLQFPFLLILKQDSSVSLVMWHVWIRGRQDHIELSASQ